MSSTVADAAPPPECFAPLQFVLDDIRTAHLVCGSGELATAALTVSVVEIAGARPRSFPPPSVACAARLPDRCLIARPFTRGTRPWAVRICREFTLSPPG